MAGSSAAAFRQSKSAVIVLVDSSSDEDDCTESERKSTNRPSAGEHGQSKPATIKSASLHSEPDRKRAIVNHTNAKRIKPTLISRTVTAKRPKFNGEDDDDDEPIIVHPTTEDPLLLSDDQNESFGGNSSSAADPTSPMASSPSTCASTSRPETPINEAFATLISACRAADSSEDMEQLISKKLTRYYQTVHPDFVNSKSFSKTALSVAAEIKAQPGLVYLKLTSILEELNIRRKSGQTVLANEESTTTGDAKKDFQIKRLNHALYVLKKKIAKLDEAEVDLNDDDNSAYLLVERCKKRACEIYEKICDLTGESKHAYREVRKPIVFQGTIYPQFNKTITSFVNRTHVFPDLFDVLRCLEHCNTQHEFKLSKEAVKRIAQDSFIMIGKMLQKRRKNDLYETVSYFTGTESDPAVEDAVLQSKLSENEKYHSRINDIIDRYANEQIHNSDGTSKPTKAQPTNESSPKPHNNNNNINQNDSAATLPTSPEQSSSCDQSHTTRSSPVPSSAKMVPTTNCTTKPSIVKTTTPTTFIYDLGLDDDDDNLLIPTTSLSLEAGDDPVLIESPHPPSINGYDFEMLSSSENIVLSDDDDGIL